MTTGTILSLVGCFMCLALYAVQRQVLLATAFCFAIAYTLFSRVWPDSGVPPQVVDALAYIFCALIVIGMFRRIKQRKAQAAARQ